MRNWIKVLIKISAIVLVIGIAIGALGFFLRKGKAFNVTFRDGKLITSDDEGVVNTLEKTTIDEFTSLDIKVANADITLIPTDGEYAIEYKITENIPEYSVTDDKLTFEANDKTSVGMIGVTTSNYVKIYAPSEVVFSSVVVNNSCGDVTIDDMTIDTLNLDLSLGDINLTNVTVNTLYKAISSCGDVNATNCSFNEVIAELSLGDMNLESTDICVSATIDDSCGDIKISITNSECSYNLETSCGDIEVNGAAVDDGVNQSANYASANGPVITATDSCGDIVLNY